MRCFTVINFLVFLCANVYGDTYYDPSEELEATTNQDSSQLELLQQRGSDQTVSGIDDKNEIIIFTVSPQDVPEEVEDKDKTEFKMDSLEESVEEARDKTLSEEVVGSSSQISSTQKLISMLQSNQDGNEFKTLLAVWLKDYQKKIEELESANKELEEEINLIEKRTKMNNLVFTNIPLSKNESYKQILQKVLHVLNGVMKLNLNTSDIAMAFRAPNQRFRAIPPIRVTFANFATKKAVLGARNKIKRTRFGIWEDNSNLFDQTRKKPVTYRNTKRRQGQRVKLVNDRLKVFVADGVLKSLKDLQEEREELFKVKPIERKMGLRN